ncbi:MAG: AraC family transcriptional regulator [Spirochaetota bacterium]
MKFRFGISDHFVLTPGAFPAEVKFFAFVVTRTTRNFSYAKHRHTAYELIYVSSGVYRCTLNGSRLIVRPGFVVVVEPGDVHEDSCVPGLCYYSVKCTVPYGNASSLSGLFSASVRPAEQVIRVPRTSFDVMTRALERDAKHADELSMRIVAERSKEFFWQTVRHIPRARLSAGFVSPATSGDFKERLNALFARSLSERLSVRAMAEEFGSSESAFFQKCADTLGMSPAKAFAHVRLEAARTLLVETNDYIRDIAMRCGFINQFHFSRLFASVYGSSPKQYRAMTARK